MADEVHAIPSTFVYEAFKCGGKKLVRRRCVDEPQLSTAMLPPRKIFKRSIGRLRSCTMEAGRWKRGEKETAGNEVRS